MKRHTPRTNVIVKMPPVMPPKKPKGESVARPPEESSRQSALGVVGGWGPGERARAHPPAPNQREAVRRLETLIQRLRYRGLEYDADIAELEVLPYLKAPNTEVSERPDDRT